jgi:lipopolysaccharide biosynthesis glycosyltransferase
VFTIGYLKHNPDYGGDIVVFHENLSDDQKLTLHRIFPRVSFRQLDKDLVIQRLGHFAASESCQGIINRYSIFYFAKFELADLLHEYDKVAWMDVDMLIRGPIGDIWNFAEFAWRPGVPLNENFAAIGERFNPKVDVVNYKTPNGGLICMSRTLQKKGEMSTAALYALFCEMQHYSVLPTGDEVALFFLAARLGAQVRYLDTRFNCASGTPGAANAHVIHAIGGDKFWNRQTLKLAYPDWWLWHDEWVRRGGEPSAFVLSTEGLSVKTPDEIVISGRFYHIWHDVFKTIRDDLPAGIIPDVQLHKKFWVLFIKGWAKDVFCIEVSKANFEFSVAVYFQGDCTAYPQLIDRISENLAPTAFARHDLGSQGVKWSRDVSRADIATNVLSAANCMAVLAR